MSHQKCHLY